MCSPIPGGLGADCDDFFNSNPQSLNEDQWLQQIIVWQNDGQALECTTSGAVANIKAEVEKLCSASPCDQNTTQARQVILNGLNRALGARDAALSW